VFAVTVDAAVPPTVADKLLVNGHPIVTAPCPNVWLLKPDILSKRIEIKNSRLKFVEIAIILNRLLIFCELLFKDSIKK
jgi:hypothetical protein